MQSPSAFNSRHPSPVRRLIRCHNHLRPNNSSGLQQAQDSRRLRRYGLRSPIVVNCLHLEISSQSAFNNNNRYQSLTQLVHSRHLNQCRLHRFHHPRHSGQQRRKDSRHALHRSDSRWPVAMNSVRPAMCSQSISNSSS